MSNDSWIDLVPSVAKPVVYAYKYRHTIQQYWVKTLVKAGSENADVIVTGLAGAGKSVLASHYSGEASSLGWALPNTSNDVEIKPITIGAWTKIVSVVPGQDNAERARVLDYALNQSDSLEGIIHVVDWGYTTLRDDSVRKSMVDVRKIDTVDKFREHNLQRELREFEELLGNVKQSIRNGRGPKWIVIAVSKIDLYESTLDDAQQYYHPGCGGPFSRLVESFYSAVGKDNIQVVCTPVCAQPEAFEWNGHKVTSQIDSVTKQRNYLRQFVDSLALLQSSVEK
jgi:hypothetical protein